MALMAPTVLIVDDHAAFRRAARALLGSDGFEVVGEAAGGREALAQATRLRPQIVVLDIQLPDIDGFEVADRLAGQPDPPQVILISSRDAGEYGGQVERAASRGFVAKSLLSGRTIRALLG